MSETDLLKDKDILMCLDLIVREYEGGTLPKTVPTDLWPMLTKKQKQKVLKKIADASGEQPLMPTEEESKSDDEKEKELVRELERIGPGDTPPGEIGESKGVKKQRTKTAAQLKEETIKGAVCSLLVSLTHRARHTRPLGGA